MRFLRRSYLIVLTTFALACSDADDGSLQIFSLNYDFYSGMDGWTPGFSDYPVGLTPESDTIYQWRAEYLPGPSGPNAVKLSCNNLNGDIFMFLKRKVEGLKPNTNFVLVFDIAMASNAMPGQGIVLKAGGSELEPKKIIENDYYRLNIDKGENLDSGETLIAFGDIGVSPSLTEYVAISRSNANSYQPLLVRSNSKGEIWLVVGTDSSYEGINTVYYTSINVVFSGSN